jgi:MgsA AAA+ ATPase C terminal
MGGKLFASQENLGSDKTDEDSDRFKVRLKDGTDASHAISGLQKMIRRGQEEHALVFVHALIESGYGLWTAKRLIMIGVEDCGLAEPSTVAVVCTLCMAWMMLKKESKPGHPPDGLPLYMAAMLLCLAKKSREVDSAAVVVGMLAKTGANTAKDVIAKYGRVIVDSHTESGRNLIRKEAKQAGVDFESAAWRDFLEKGAALANRVAVDGDKWGKRCYSMLGYDFDAMMRTQDEEIVSANKPEESKLSRESGSSQERQEAKT